MKRLLTMLTAGLLTATMLTTVASAADGGTLKLDGAGLTNGYTVRGYYGDTEVFGSMESDGTYYFSAGGSEEAFYYSIYDKNGTCVVDKELLYNAPVRFLADDEVFDVYAPVTYEESVLHNLKESGVDTSEMEQIFEDNATQNTIISNTGGADSQVQKPVVTNGIALRIVNVKAVSLLDGSTFKVTLTDAAGKVKEYPISRISSEVLLDDTLTSGTYSVKFSDFGKGIAGIKGTDTITATVNTDYLDITVTPACVLEVKRAKETSAEYKVKGISGVFNISEGAIGVKPGNTYTVIDMKTGKSFEVAIPSNATKHTLDLGTADGAPTNNSAYQDAELDQTASEDNPFNIPPTYDVSEVAEHNRAVGMLVTVVGLVVVGLAIYVMFRIKKRP